MNIAPNEITVSVVMICYNQEQYIAEAIKSVLVQQTKFNVELIISNDCSTDNTDGVIGELIDDYKGNINIRYYKQADNLGMKKNFEWALSKIRGEYAAFCEGDDFWTNPTKLEYQINFLRQNIDYSLCFHNANTLYHSGIRNSLTSHIEDREYSSNEVLSNWIVPTASVVFRVSALGQEIYHSNVVNGDIVVVLSCGDRGKIRGMKDCFCSYRMHNQGISEQRILDKKAAFYYAYEKHYIFIKESFRKISPQVINTKLRDIQLTLFQIRRPSIVSIFHLLKAIYYDHSFFINRLKKKLFK